MRARVVPMAVAVCTALLLGGCSGGHVPPPSFTDDELTQYFSDRIDAAWVNTGLEGTVDRPEIEMRDVAPVNEGSQPEFNNCISRLGVTSWGMDERDGGPVFLSASGGDLPPDQQLAFYSCFAEFPASEGSSPFLLTEAQKAYLYDFYQSWTIPCLESNGYPVGYMPTRAEFVASFGTWVPYFMVDPGDNVLDSSDFATMHDRCGDAFADLDVDEPQWF